MKAWQYGKWDVMVQRLGGDGPANGYKRLLCVCVMYPDRAGLPLHHPKVIPHGCTPSVSHTYTHKITHTSHIPDTEGDSLRMIVPYIYMQYFSIQFRIVQIIKLNVWNYAFTQTISFISHEKGSLSSWGLPFWNHMTNQVLPEAVYSRDGPLVLHWIGEIENRSFS